ncbi:MAG TPA: Mov34/MPN/PAD-1 family protein [Terriglobales bacterium]|nr:Mov34/MPN/PAD-1 family protein [Terriglobales bacterium]
MSQKAKTSTGQPAVILSGDVARKMRQHARTSLSAEICGVLIGQDRPGRVEIQACIAGAKAEEAGAHVTFTQDTWEHIYQVKDKQYPDARIVGWYHSHPGFGIFLSEHDTFIHRNFFASPGQVAWVCDPQSDEEGCFGWVDGQIERLSQVTISDRRGGERVSENSGSEPPQFRAQQSPEFSAEDRVQVTARQSFSQARTPTPEPYEETSNDSLLRLTATIFSYLTVLILGAMISWFLFPRIELVPVPVDPLTGKPLPEYSISPPQDSSKGLRPENQTSKPTQPAAPTDDSKEDHGGSK